MNREIMAANLKLLRKRRNETQIEVAKAVGVSGGAYGMYETGERIPRDEVKAKLSDHFGVTVQAIFFDGALT